jgi:hypothetical protein
MNFTAKQGRAGGTIAKNFDSDSLTLSEIITGLLK